MSMLVEKAPLLISKDMEVLLEKLFCEFNASVLTGRPPRDVFKEKMRIFAHKVYEDQDSGDD